MAELYALDAPAQVSRWSLPMLIGGQRVEVTGGTTLTPAEFTERSWRAPFLVGAGSYWSWSWCWRCG